MGKELLVVERARCLHGEGTIGLSLRRTGRFMPGRVRNNILNRWQTILKLYQGGTLLRLAPALVAFEVFQLAGAVRKRWLGHWLWAARWLVRNLPALVRRRRAFAPLRRRADLDVLSGGPFPFAAATTSGPLERAAVRLLDRAAVLNWRLATRGR
jgi:hypothetical protein